MMKVNVAPDKEGQPKLNIVVGQKVIATRVIDVAPPTKKGRVGLMLTHTRYN